MKIGYIGIDPGKSGGIACCYNDDKTFNEDVYYQEKPLIVSTAKNHCCFNESKEPRYTFQICFYDPIERLAELDQKGELFNV